MKTTMRLDRLYSHSLNLHSNTIPLPNLSLMDPDKLSGFRSSSGHLISYSFRLGVVLVIFKCNLIRNVSLFLSGCSDGLSLCVHTSVLQAGHEVASEESERNSQTRPLLCVTLAWQN